MRRNIFLQTLLALVLLFGCSGSGSVGFNIFPDSKDIELGREIDREIRKNPEQYPLLGGRPDIRQYIEQIGEKILASPEIKKRGLYAYRFEIIYDDSTINAFCTPGGYIYIYTGILRFLENEATLAGVIGHEIAHAERRHATKRISSALGVQILLSILLGQNPAESARLAANLFAGLGLLANSRADETEADMYSIRYLQSTAYYPGAIKFFFEKVSAVGKRSSLERFLSTHPLPQDRIENVEKIVASLGIPQPQETNLFHRRYEQFKRTLP
jgi:predicted Zn-dependent protease